MQVHRDIMDGRYHAASVRGRRVWRLCVASARASKTAPIIEGPCFIDEEAVVKTGARIGPYSVIGRQCHIEEHATVDRPSSGPTRRISQEAVVRNSMLGRQLPYRPQRRRRGRRHSGRQVGRHRLQPTL